jgi:hypothetical protein
MKSWSIKGGISHFPSMGATCLRIHDCGEAPKWTRLTSGQLQPRLTALRFLFSVLATGAKLSLTRVLRVCFKRIVYETIG